MLPTAAVAASQGISSNLKKFLNNSPREILYGLKYKCSECGISFRYEHTLVIHLRSHNIEIKTVTEEPNLLNTLQKTKFHNDLTRKINPIYVKERCEFNDELCENDSNIIVCPASMNIFQEMTLVRNTNDNPVVDDIISSSLRGISSQVTIRRAKNCNDDENSQKASNTVIIGPEIARNFLSITQNTSITQKRQRPLNEPNISNNISAVERTFTRATTQFDNTPVPQNISSNAVHQSDGGMQMKSHNHKIKFSTIRKSKRFPKLAIEMKATRDIANVRRYNLRLTSHKNHTRVRDLDSERSDFLSVNSLSSTTKHTNILDLQKFESSYLQKVNETLDNVTSVIPKINKKKRVQKLIQTKATGHMSMKMTLIKQKKIHSKINCDDDKNTKETTSVLSQNVLKKDKRKQKITPKEDPDKMLNKATSDLQKIKPLCIKKVSQKLNNVTSVIPKINRKKRVQKLRKTKATGHMSMKMTLIKQKKIHSKINCDDDKNTKETTSVLPQNVFKKDKSKQKITPKEDPNKILNEATSDLQKFKPLCIQKVFQTLNNVTIVIPKITREISMTSTNINEEKVHKINFNDDESTKETSSILPQNVIKNDKRKIKRNLKEDPNKILSEATSDLQKLKSLCVQNVNHTLDNVNIVIPKINGQKKVQKINQNETASDISFKTTHINEEKIRRINVSDDGNTRESSSVKKDKRKQKITPKEDLYMVPNDATSDIFKRIIKAKIQNTIPKNDSDQTLHKIATFEIQMNSNKRKTLMKTMQDNPGQNAKTSDISNKTTSNVKHENISLNIRSHPNTKRNAIVINKCGISHAPAELISQTPSNSLNKTYETKNIFSEDEKQIGCKANNNAVIRKQKITPKEDPDKIINEATRDLQKFKPLCIKTVSQTLNNVTTVIPKISRELSMTSTNIKEEKDYEINVNDDENTKETSLVLPQNVVNNDNRKHKRTPKKDSDKILIKAICDLQKLKTLCVQKVNGQKKVQNINENKAASDISLKTTNINEEKIRRINVNDDGNAKETSGVKKDKIKQKITPKEDLYMVPNWATSDIPKRIYKDIIQNTIPKKDSDQTLHKIAALEIQMNSKERKTLMITMQDKPGQNAKTGDISNKTSNVRHENISSNIRSRPNTRRNACAIMKCGISHAPAELILQTHSNTLKKTYETKNIVSEDEKQVDYTANNNAVINCQDFSYAFPKSEECSVNSTQLYPSVSKDIREKNTQNINDLSKSDEDLKCDRKPENNIYPIVIPHNVAFNSYIINSSSVEGVTQSVDEDNLAQMVCNGKQPDYNISSSMHKGLLQNQHAVNLNPKRIDCSTEIIRDCLASNSKSMYSSEANGNVICEQNAKEYEAKTGLIESEVIRIRNVPVKIFANLRMYSNKISDVDETNTPETEGLLNESQSPKNTQNKVGEHKKPPVKIASDLSIDSNKICGVSKINSNSNPEISNEVKSPKKPKIGFEKDSQFQHNSPFNEENTKKTVNSSYKEKMNNGIILDSISKNSIVINGDLIFFKEIQNYIDESKTPVKRNQIVKLNNKSLFKITNSTNIDSPITCSNDVDVCKIVSTRIGESCETIVCKDSNQMLDRKINKKINKIPDKVYESIDLHETGNNFVDTNTSFVESNSTAISDTIKITKINDNAHENNISNMCLKKSETTDRICGNMKNNTKCFHCERETFDGAKIGSTKISYIRETKDQNRKFRIVKYNNDLCKRQFLNMVEIGSIDQKEFSNDAISCPIADSVNHDTITSELSNITKKIYSGTEICCGITDIENSNESKSYSVCEFNTKTDDSIIHPRFDSAAQAFFEDLAPESCHKVLALTNKSFAINIISDIMLKPPKMLSSYENTGNTDFRSEYEDINNLYDVPEPVCEIDVLTTNDGVNISVPEIETEYDITAVESDSSTHIGKTQIDKGVTVELEKTECLDEQKTKLYICTSNKNSKNKETNSEQESCTEKHFKDKKYPFDIDTTRKQSSQDKARKYVDRKPSQDNQIEPINDSHSGTINRITEIVNNEPTNKSQSDKSATGVGVRALKLHSIKKDPTYVCDIKMNSVAVHDAKKSRNNRTKIKNNASKLKEFDFLRISRTPAKTLDKRKENSTSYNDYNKCQHRNTNSSLPKQCNGMSQHENYKCQQTYDSLLINPNKKKTMKGLLKSVRPSISTIIMDRKVPSNSNLTEINGRNIKKNEIKESDCLPQSFNRSVIYSQVIDVSSRKIESLEIESTDKLSNKVESKFYSVEHIRITCTHCGQHFSNRYFYKRHLKKVHKCTIFKKCDDCKKVFSRERSSFRLQIVKAIKESIREQEKHSAFGFKIPFVLLSKIDISSYYLRNIRNEEQSDESMSKIDGIYKDVSESDIVKQKYCGSNNMQKNNYKMDITMKENDETGSQKGNDQYTNIQKEYCDIDLKNDNSKTDKPYKLNCEISLGQKDHSEIEVECLMDNNFTIDLTDDDSMKNMTEETVIVQYIQGSEKTLVTEQYVTQFAKNDTKRFHEDPENYNSDSIDLKCVMCGLEFNSKIQLLSHLNLEHQRSSKNKRKFPTKEAKYKCKKCAKSFRYKDSLVRHFNSSHKLFTCAICCQEFTRKYNLKMHFKTVHKETCTICQLTFNTKEVLKKHLQSNHNPGRQNNTSMAFHLQDPFVNDLETELMMYSNVNKCVLCEDTFDSRDELRKHVGFHHIQPRLDREDAENNRKKMECEDGKDHKKRSKQNRRTVTKQKSQIDDNCCLNETEVKVLMLNAPIITPKNNVTIVDTGITICEEFNIPECDRKCSQINLGGKIDSKLCSFHTHTINKTSLPAAVCSSMSQSCESLEKINLDQNILKKCSTNLTRIDSSKKSPKKKNIWIKRMLIPRKATLKHSENNKKEVNEDWKSWKPKQEITLKSCEIYDLEDEPMESLLYIESDESDEEPSLVIRTPQVNLGEDHDKGKNESSSHKTISSLECSKLVSQERKETSFDSIKTISCLKGLVEYSKCPKQIKPTLDTPQLIEYNSNICQENSNKKILKEPKDLETPNNALRSDIFCHSSQIAFPKLEIEIVENTEEKIIKNTSENYENSRMSPKTKKSCLERSVRCSKKRKTNSDTPQLFEYSSNISYESSDEAISQSINDLELPKKLSSLETIYPTSQTKFYNLQTEIDENSNKTINDTYKESEGTSSIKSSSECLEKHSKRVCNQRKIITDTIQLNSSVTPENSDNEKSQPQGKLLYPNNAISSETIYPILHINGSNSQEEIVQNDKKNYVIFTNEENESISPKTMISSLDRSVRYSKRISERIKTAIVLPQLTKPHSNISQKEGNKEISSSQIEAPNNAISLETIYHSSMIDSSSLQPEVNNFIANNTATNKDRKNEDIMSPKTLISLSKCSAKRSKLVRKRRKTTLDTPQSIKKTFFSENSDGKTQPPFYRGDSESLDDSLTSEILSSSSQMDGSDSQTINTHESNDCCNLPSYSYFQSNFLNLQTSVDSTNSSIDKIKIETSSSKEISSIKNKKRRVSMSHLSKKGVTYNSNYMKEKECESLSDLMCNPFNYIKCPHCTGFFPSQEARQRHIEWEHMNNVMLHKCGECHQVFESYKKLRLHFVTQHASLNFEGAHDVGDMIDPNKFKWKRFLANSYTSEVCETVVNEEVEE